MYLYRYIILFVATILHATSLVTPIEYIEYDKQKAQLGKKLFLDTKLSRDNTVACVSCHNIYTSGTEITKVSTGIDNQKGDRNSPTVFNAVYNFRQFWDGRAKDLKEQALMPITNPIEMGNSIENVLKTLKSDKEYLKEFTKIYSDGITKDNLADAIAEFEKALVTPNSRFDKYIKGNKEMLSDDEIAGYNLFIKKGCISCHNGKNFGGNMYQKFGVVIFVDDSVDLGRYRVTKKQRDKFLFKVPSLRNISNTAPYFHDGRVNTLQEAIRVMAKRQIGRSVTDKEVELIEKFLITLEGELPKIVED
jgi:cytochrome c peroxidase